ncbi:hypothetical protein D3C85_1636270 [compost metagenome]
MSIGDTSSLINTTNFNTSCTCCKLSSGPCCNGDPANIESITSSSGVHVKADGLVGVRPNLEGPFVITIEQLGACKGSVAGDTIDLTGQLVHLFLQGIAIFN